MARHENSIWDILSRAVEGVLTHLPATSGSSKTQSTESDPLPVVLAGAATALVATALTSWAESRRPGFSRLWKGAAAGAGAAGVVLALRVLLEEDEDISEGRVREVSDELLAGAGRGVLYAALLDPLLPGPPLVRGAVAGTADYLVAPLGGLFSQLQPLSPIRRVPIISILLETGDADPDPYRDFLLYGILLGLFYGDDSTEG